MVTQPHAFFEDLKLAIANQENLFLLVISSKHFKAKFNELMKALAAQKPKNPFSRYYQPVNAKRFNPQKGMIIPIDKRPQIKYRSKYFLFNEEEYFII